MTTCSPPVVLTSARVVIMSCPPAERMVSMDTVVVSRSPARTGRVGHEALLAVHHAGVVDPELGVLDDLPGRGERQHERERGRGDDVRMSERLGGGRVPVGGVGVADGGRELADLLDTDGVGLGRRVGAPGVSRVDRHARDANAPASRVRPGRRRVSPWSSSSSRDAEPGRDRDQQVQDADRDEQRSRCGLVPEPEHEGQGHQQNRQHDVGGDVDADGDRS